MRVRLHNVYEHVVDNTLMQSEVSLQASGSIKRFTPFATKLVQAAADQLAQPSIGTG